MDTKEKNEKTLEDYKGMVERAEMHAAKSRKLLKVSVVLMDKLEKKGIVPYQLDMYQQTAYINIWPHTISYADVLEDPLMGERRSLEVLDVLNDVKESLDLWESMYEEENPLFISYGFEEKIHMKFSEEEMGEIKDQMEATAGRQISDITFALTVSDRQKLNFPHIKKITLSFDKNSRGETSFGKRKYLNKVKRINKS